MLSETPPPLPRDRLEEHTRNGPPKHPWNHPGATKEHPRKTPKQHPRNTPGTPLEQPESTPSTAHQHSQNIPGAPKEHPKSTQERPGASQEHAGEHPGSSPKAPQKCPRDHPRNGCHATSRYQFFLLLFNFYRTGSCNLTTQTGHFTHVLNHSFYTCVKSHAVGCHDTPPVGANCWFYLRNTHFVNCHATSFYTST